MKILNPQVRSDLDAGVSLKLDLGSGGEKLDGFYSVDLLELDGVDIVADLNEPLELLPDNSVEQIYTRHTLEHIENLVGLLREIRRITKPDGTIEIIVPHFSNPHYYSDPTHIRPFAMYSMYYYMDHAKQPAKRKVPCFYSDVRFIVEKVEIDFYYTTFLDRLVAPIIRRLTNRSPAWQEFYERRLSRLWHARQVRYVMRPDKHDGGSNRGTRRMTRKI